MSVRNNNLDYTGVQCFRIYMHVAGEGVGPSLRKIIRMVPSRIMKRDDGGSPSGEGR